MSLLNTCYKKIRELCIANQMSTSLFFIILISTSYTGCNQVAENSDLINRVDALVDIKYAGQIIVVGSSDVDNSRYSSDAFNTKFYYC